MLVFGCLRCLLALLFLFNRSSKSHHYRQYRRCSSSRLSGAHLRRKFLPRDALQFASDVLAMALCLSVCPSVTSRCSTKTAKRYIMLCCSRSNKCDQ